MNRIDRPRFSVRGDVLATFHPRGCNYYNCRAGHMFVRKYRGPRRQGRAWKLAKLAHEARLTPAEIDALAQATVAKVAKSRVIALDRKATPFTDCMRKAFHL